MTESAIYDSVLEDALRLARRRWHLLVVVMVLGALLGAVLTLRTSSVEGSRRIQFADTPALAGLLGVPPVEVDLPRIVASLRDALDAADVSGSVRADPSTGTLEITITGDDAEGVTDDLDHWQSDALARIDATLRPQLDDAVVAAEQRVLSLETTIADLGDAGDDPDVERTRAELLVALSEARSELDNLQSYRSAVFDRLTDTVTTEINEGGGVARGVAVGALVALVLLAVGLGLHVVFDPHIRRRLQIEKVAPTAVALGVAPDPDEAGDEECGAVAAAIDALASSAGVPEDGAVPVVGMGEHEAATAAVALYERGGGRRRLSMVEHGLPPGPGEPGPVVVAARFGRSTENQLSSALATLRAAGFDRLGVLLVGVPRRELDWAGVSARN